MHLCLIDKNMTKDMVSENRYIKQHSTVKACSKEESFAHKNVNCDII